MIIICQEYLLFIADKFLILCESSGVIKVERLTNLKDKEWVRKRLLEFVEGRNTTFRAIAKNVELLDLPGKTNLGNYAKKGGPIPTWHAFVAIALGCDSDLETLMHSIDPAPTDDMKQEASEESKFHSKLTEILKGPAEKLDSEILKLRDLIVSDRSATGPIKIRGSGGGQGTRRASSK